VQPTRRWFKSRVRNHRTIPTAFRVGAIGSVLQLTLPRTFAIFLQAFDLAPDADLVCHSNPAHWKAGHLHEE
jgi:hypothetical protein